MERKTTVAFAPKGHRMKAWQNAAEARNVISGYIAGNVAISFATGAALSGVIGALSALPIGAIYPATKRIWLADYLGSDVAAEHVRLERRPQEADHFPVRG
ncbi:MAG: hypothetical protein M3Z09_02180 [Acidobacteriota bacterium]|nr:hypothetical protein [Acidobacteriota bacterium]